MESRLRNPDRGRRGSAELRVSFYRALTQLGYYNVTFSECESEALAKLSLYFKFESLQPSSVA